MGRRPWCAASLLAAAISAPGVAGQDSLATSEAAAPAIPALDLAVTYSADIWANTSGGIARGVRYLDKLLAEATLDGGRALGWDGVTFYASALYTNGASLTDDLVGDYQVVSNIETGERLVRLFEAWVEAPIAGHTGSLRVGLYDLNTEFDVTDSGALFLNSGHGSS